MSTNAVPAQTVPSIFDRIADGVPARHGLTAGDPRADNRRRSVLLTRDRVTIDRSYRGIAMRLSVPVSAYQGVCVAVKPTATGGFFYELRLAHRDPDLSITLVEAIDEGRIWADWRASAGYFNVPALVERNDGPEAWAPPLAGGDHHDRRAKRRHRPGIVTRRAVRLEALQTVHREDEIIARD